MGPDGAIYIADWYNPIIQHGEVDFRDPRRDHTHGRISRVTARGRPLVPRPKLVGARPEELLQALKLPEDWTRLRARRVLKERGRKAVLPALAAWVGKLDPQDRGHEENLLEALWTYQALDVVEPKLLTVLLAAHDHRVRAAACRVVAAWEGRLSNALELLTARVKDAHPRSHGSGAGAGQGEDAASGGGGPGRPGSSDRSVSRLRRLADAARTGAGVVAGPAKGHTHFRRQRPAPDFRPASGRRGHRYGRWWNWCAPARCRATERKAPWPLSPPWAVRKTSASSSTWC